MRGPTGRVDTADKYLKARKGDDEGSEAASDLGGRAAGVPEELAWGRQVGAAVVLRPRHALLLRLLGRGLPGRPRRRRPPGARVLHVVKDDGDRLLHQHL